MQSTRWIYSASGLGAVMLWAGTIGVSRILTEAWGVLTTGAAIFLVAGSVGCAISLVGRGRRSGTEKFSLKYLLVCGGLFVAYMLFLYTAVALAPTNQQVLEVGVINYLWPVLVIGFSIPILHNRPRWFLPVGLLMGFGGILLGSLGGEIAGWGAFRENLRDNALIYLLALGAAVSWGLYSNLVRRWSPRDGHGAVPIFILGTGVLMGAMGLLWGTAPSWEPNLIGWLVLMAMGPTLSGYVLWELAMRKGSVVFCAAAAYLTPLLSTLITSLIHRVNPPPALWGGCILVITAAVVSKAGIRPPERGG